MDNAKATVLIFWTTVNFEFEYFLKRIQEKTDLNKIMLISRTGTQLSYLNPSLIMLR